MTQLDFDKHLLLIQSKPKPVNNWRSIILESSPNFSYTKAQLNLAWPDRVPTSCSFNWFIIIPLVGPYLWVLLEKKTIQKKGKGKERKRNFHPFLLLRIDKDKLNGNFGIKRRLWKRQTDMTRQCLCFRLDGPISARSFAKQTHTDMWSFWSRKHRLCSLNLCNQEWNQRGLFLKKMARYLSVWTT